MIADTTDHWILQPMSNSNLHPRPSASIRGQSHSSCQTFYRLAAVCVLLGLSLIGCSDSITVPAQGRPAVTLAVQQPAVTQQAETATAESSTDANFDWPYWRGPRHDGISLEPLDVTGWSAAEPGKLWSAKIGTGFSSLSVVQGKVYTMGHRGGDDTVYCFAAADGSEIWKRSYPCELVDNLHEGGPAATPTVDGDRVYTVSKQGHTFCLAAATGELLWKVNLSELLGVDMPEWGFSCSPRVLGDQLLIEAGRTASFDKHSGKLLWQSEKFRPGYGSPAVFEHGGRTLVAVLNNDCLLVVRADDGSQVAQYPWETDFATTSTTPIVSGDTIFISSGYNRGCALLKLASGGLEEIYANRNMSNHMNNCVHWQGHLYGFDGNSHNARTVKLTCIEYATGQTKWEQRGLGCGSLFLTDGKMVALSDDGQLVVLAAQPTEYRELARTKILSGRCWTVPVLSNGRLFARNARGDVVCVAMGSEK